MDEKNLPRAGLRWGTLEGFSVGQSLDPECEPGV